MHAHSGKGKGIKGEQSKVVLTIVLLCRGGVRCSSTRRFAILSFLDFKQLYGSGPAVKKV